MKVNEDGMAWAAASIGGIATEANTAAIRGMQERGIAYRPLSFPRK
jgi:hypothetical protein